MTPDSGWVGYEKLVLDKLENLDRRLHDLDNRITLMHENDITAIKVEIAMLKVKSGLWGAAAGFVPAAAIVAFYLARGA